MAGKRSPTAHRTPEQIREHGRTYQAKPEQKKRRASRNAARSKMQQAGAVKKGDGKDVAHKDNNPRNNARSNLRVQSPAKNRALTGRRNARKR